MTELQAAQIKVLRKQGKGYKAIASVVGLSRDIVRNYCKANNMEGYGIMAALNILEKRADRADLEETALLHAGRVDE